MSTEKNLQGKIALVTGGSRGIGRAISQALAERGALVYINFRKRESEAQEAKKLIEKAGGSCRLLQADISKEEEIQSIIDQIKEESGALDILVSNAVTGVLKPISELSVSDWHFVMNTNVLSLMHLVQKALPIMENQPYGRIISLSSHGSWKAYPMYGSIGISKAALETMSMYLADELAPKNITVNVIRGGTVKTDAIKNFPNLDKMLAQLTKQTPMGKLTSAEDIGSLAAYLCSAEAGMITGQNITVDGGISIR
ncbi:SDR family oxidoreductase [Peijinzhouia sedimentorum]